MIKKLLIFMFVILFIQTAAHANSTTVTIQVTMPEVVVIRADNDLDESTENQDYVYDEVVFAEETMRDGKPVIIKSTVSK